MAGRDQDEERVQQGKPSIHHLEQLVEDERQGDIGYGDHDMRDETEPVEQFVRLDVLGSSCSIAGHHHDGGNDANGEGAQDDIDQVQCAGDSCQLAWRSAPNGVHQ